MAQLHTNVALLALQHFPHAAVGLVRRHAEHQSAGREELRHGSEPMRAATGELQPAGLEAAAPLAQKRGHLLGPLLLESHAAAFRRHVTLSGERAGEHESWCVTDFDGAGEQCAICHAGCEGTEHSVVLRSQKAQEIILHT